jgi:hypothetical protein
VRQEQTEWCWAGVSSAVLAYYGKSVPQCEIANFARTTATWHDFGSEDCCLRPSGSCNYWNYNYGQSGSIQEILKRWGVQNSGVDRALTLVDLKKELEAKRPFVIRWARSAGGGHFVVGHGLTDSMLHYMDPWPGEGAKIARYGQVVSSSQNTWTHTNLLSTTPPTSAQPFEAPRVERLSVQRVPGGISLSYSLPQPMPVVVRLFTLRGERHQAIDLGIRPGGPQRHQIALLAPLRGILLVHLQTSSGPPLEAILLPP